MAKQILKSIAIGILSGIVLFLIPLFIIKVFLIFFIVRLIFRIGGWGRYRSGWKSYNTYGFSNETISGMNQPDWIIVPKQNTRRNDVANVKNIIIK